MAYRSNEPYNDLPTLPPRAHLETLRVMRRCVSASRALAELKGAGNLSQPGDPHQHDPAPGGEAKLGDREHRHHPRCALPPAIERGAQSDPATRRFCVTGGIAAWVRAGAGKPLDIAQVQEVCEVLAVAPARLRAEEPVIIEDIAAGMVLYTPPVRSRIVRLLPNLVRFLGEYGN